MFTYMENKKIVLIAIVIWLGVDIVNNVKELKYIGQDALARNTIQVIATGEVFASPNLSLIDLSVVTEKENVSEALEENTAKMNRIIGFLKERGIEERDLRTTGFNIYPVYEWIEGLPYQPPGKRLLTGYEVRSSLQVKVRNLGQVGELIQGTAELGANQIGNLQFTVENQDDLTAQARGRAIDEAKAKAKELSSQLGIKLDKITEFHESTGFPIYYQSLEAAGKGGETMQIQPGENKIEVTVTITYEIN